jgi:hypothetical protein
MILLLLIIQKPWLHTIIFSLFFAFAFSISRVRNLPRWFIGVSSLSLLPTYWGMESTDK